MIRTSFISSGRSSFLCAVLSATLALAAFLCASNSHASGMTFAAEAGPEVSLVDVDNDDIERWGFGGSGRIGYTIDLPLIAFTPEAKLGFHSPGKPDLFAMTGGLRINFLEGISPAVFSHLGGVVGDVRGFVWDAGIGFDLTFIPHVDLGVFATYYRVGKATFSANHFSAETTNFHWMQFGFQGAIHL